MVRWLGIIFVACTVGCITPDLVDCGDGTVCPPGFTCGQGGCRSSEQQAACSDRTEGERCVISTGAGHCLGGACIVVRCGDGVVGEGEVCDDGNSESGDGCDAACASTEVCGNGIVELAEVCDCGDASHPGPVICAGTTNDGPICNTFCQLRNCGDGILDPGESCDDGNAISGDGCRADCAKIEICGDLVLDDGEGCDDGNANASDGCDACVPTMWAATVVVGGNQLASALDIAPSAIAYDRAGNLYIADIGAPRIVRVAPNGTVTPFAGTGVSGGDGDGGPATSARISLVTAIAVDGRGTVYIADYSNHRVRRIDARGIITTVAGTGIAGFSGDGGPAIAARLSSPRGVVVDGLGQLVIADSGNARIRLVDVTGKITTIAGTGVSGVEGDGGPAIDAQFRFLLDVALDASNRVVVVDQSHRVRRIDIDGTISTIAGTGTAGFTGDGGPATAAQLSSPSGIAYDAAGVLYIGDSVNQRIRKVAADGTITTVAGVGIADFSGDGGDATAAYLSFPGRVAIHPAGGFVINDGSNRRVRYVNPAGTISTIAGTGSTYRVGDGAAATTVLLATPGVGVDASGRLLIADLANNRIRRVDPDGVIRTIAGIGGERGFSGDGGPALAAQFSEPTAVIDDGQGNLFVADAGNRRVRRISSGGIVTTVAGGGTDGDGELATAAQLDYLGGIALTADGDLIIVERDANRVRRVDHATLTISTVAGFDGVSGFDGDGGDAFAAQLATPQGVAVNAAGDIYIADSGNHRIRVVDRTSNVITTFAGGGTGGDGGLAIDAELYNPVGVALFNGDVYITDTYNDRIRRVTADVISTVAGTSHGYRGDGDAAVLAQLQTPGALAISADGTIYSGHGNYGYIRRIDPAGEITTVVGTIDPVGAGPLGQAQLVDPQAFVIAGGATWIAGGNSGTLARLRTNPGWLEVVAGRYPQTGAIGGRARYRGAGFGAVGGVAHDASANLVFITEGNQVHAVTMVDPTDTRTWTIAPLANGSGAPGFADGPAATARFRGPTGLFLDGANNQLYVADTGNHVVRAIDLSNGIANAIVSTVAGTPSTLGYDGDGALALDALLDRPQAITRCSNGDLFVADTGNHRVRRITANTNEISTVLGDGSPGSAGEGSPAATFPVDSPRGLACDEVGNLFVTSTTSVRLLSASASGAVDGTGSVQTVYGAPPRDQFPASITRCLTGIVVVDAKRVQVADGCTGLLIELERVANP